MQILHDDGIEIGIIAVDHPQGSQACPRCGRPMKQAMIGQRTTVWCGHCQR